MDRLNFDDFYKWDSISDKYFKGNLTGKISVMTFKKDKNAKYKVSMNSEAKTYDVEVQTKAKLDTLVVPRYLRQNMMTWKNYAPIKLFLIAFK